MAWPDLLRPEVGADVSGHHIDDSGGTEPHGPDPSEPGRPGRNRRLGWILGATAAIAALGLGISALVVALNDEGETTSTASTGGSSAAACAVTSVAQRELPSVVTILVAPRGAGTGQVSGTGSGEVIDSSGHLLTNNHVVAAAAGGGTITVIFENGHSQVAKLVGRDPQTDVAVLKVPDAAGLRPIAFGSSQKLKVGQPVIALGAPLGLANSVTSGIVSALDRSIDVPSDNGTSAVLVGAIQTDAAINPGNSGGALVNCSGQLVGVPSAGATVPNPSGGTSAGNIGIGFAIPSDFARKIADDLIATGRVNHGTFGVTVVTIGAPGTGSANGLYVTSVIPGGPAAKAGLHAGDVITEIEGQPAASAQQLLALTLEHRAGSTVTLTYERNGATHQAKVTLGSR